MTVEPPLQTEPPIRNSLLKNLTTQTTLLTQLFTQLGTSTPQTATVQNIHAQLCSSTDDLARLTRDLEKHQQVWNSVLIAQERVEGLEKKVREICKELEKGSRELDEMVWSAKVNVENIKRSEKNPLNIPNLLAHAQALSKTSSAPISSLLTPSDKAQYPPWPTEAAMRMGLLFQLQGSMTQGQTGEIAEEIPTQSMEIEQPTLPQEEGRSYDPDAVYNLDLDSDSD
ncbi:hypothetical protein M231_05942 [Tremella mesenterica]|uniref:Mediator of RNA polymerase II transcription subunit 4 n=1 Tax=Tremella mesenterica TaxID=5217 RepID=A0A4Q1BGS4_TREME|nr:hypothetical protein M231_05942 [Tremella mesenterica]